jgi:transcriptional regulator with GAF, ATPase, and Fis domain/predicted Ser/Thr protein kinase
MRAIERYEIVRPLGAGGQGTVYLVRDRFLGGESLALKRIGARSDDLLRASFEREFSVLASLSLPGIARVMDFGLSEPDGDDPGGPFFTRAYIDGEPLDVRVRGSAPEETIRLFLGVTRLVEALHRVGIVHGDLKPANLLVDKSGHPHVIDFGLARLASDRTARGTGGTPAYMAPELLRGEPPSAAADVYALGAMLFKLLTGLAPLEQHGDRALSLRLAGELPSIPEDKLPIERAALEVALLAIAPDAERRIPAVLELRSMLEARTGLASVDFGAGFVPPRPRGHEDLLAQLDHTVSARLEGRGGEQSAVLLRGENGSGKTTLLRELKWRLQVRGIRVLEASAIRGSALGPLLGLGRQGAVLGARDADSVAAKGADPEELAQALSRALRLLNEKAPVALLLDDIDAMEPVVTTALRLTIHTEGVRVVLVGTARQLETRAMAELGARQSIEVPALDAADVAKIAEDALGPADVTVTRALHKRTRGLPGLVVEVLAHLAARGQAPTAKDVETIRVEAGEALARVSFSRLSAEAKRLVEVLASVPIAVPEEAALAVAKASAASLSEARTAGVVIAGPDGLSLSDRAVGAVVSDDRSSEELEVHARGLLAHPAIDALDIGAKARLAVVAGDSKAIVELAPRAVEELSARGLYEWAVEVLRAYLPLADPATARQGELDLARLLSDLARHEDAAEVALGLSRNPDATPDERTRALVAASRAWTELGAFDRAASALESVPADAASSLRALAHRVLAKVLIARGDYPAAERAASLGLASASADDPVRIELLTSIGMVASYLGDHERARARYNEALSLARAKGSRRDEALVIAYLGIDHHRMGDHRGARDLYERSLEIARQLGDIGNMASYSLNLGTVTQELGEPSEAARHYESAARLARRAGRAPADVIARCNLANLHVYLGLYQRAGREADDALHDALEAGMKPSAAQATALLGDVAARLGDVETALARFDDATQTYKKLGRRREVAETLLDSAEALLDRNGPADTSAAVGRLAEARTIIDEEKLEEFRLRLRWLLARARADTGDSDGAVADLEKLLAEAREASDRELVWKTLATLARLNALRGADFVARRQDQEAMELLESIATKLPRDQREAFWHDPRRREVRKRAGVADRPPASRLAPMAFSDSTFHPVGLEARTARLLELIKRLASEHEVDRLLERITDSAVELAGAERGFVLLVGENGQLAARTVRDASAHSSDPHVAFSQSIAEAVLIDGEPIITVDARDDTRLSEYMSVHKLMLKSVACLPIRGRAGALGVLYLEHRMRRGRFDEADVDLLFAFADQAAIALENAKLIAENERRRLELERTNVELERAKDEIERVLVARTAELEDAKREVDRARAQLRSNYSRHGLVGSSEAMRRVFSLIDRVRDTSVSVVIQGESGTGKELVARAIHYAGPRSAGPFVALNCAAIPETLLESELFGHVRGAFTGADRDRRGVIIQASGGTLFLDEVGDMPAKMQIDLLRVLQERTVRPIGGDRDELVDVRVIAASNKSLQREAEKGTFREDLFYRLNVVEIRLPALRERTGDIPLLCDHFLALFAKRDGVRQKRLTREAQKRLVDHPMPGNVRQLEHVLLNAWVLVEGEIIDADDLALDDSDLTSDAAVARASNEPRPQTLRDHKHDEKHRILTALEEFGWNRVRAAKALGMPRRTFYRRLKEYDILV